MNERDAERLTRLWTEAQPIVASYVFSLLPDFHRTEDVVQEVGVTLVKRFHEYDSTLPFLPWAMGMAKNKVLNARRAVVNDRHLFDEALADHLLAVGSEGTAESRGALRQALQQCLGKQQGRVAEVLRLRYALNLKPARIAQQMGVTGGAVRTLLHRARATLRECISHQMKEILR